MDADYLYFFHQLPACTLAMLRKIARHASPCYLWEHGKKADFLSLGIEADKVSQLIGERKTINLEESLNILRSKNIYICSIRDHAYPILLKNIHDPPALLYMLGDKSILSHSNKIAIVGTRYATEYGLNVSKLIIKNLNSANAAPVTGGAFGVDTVVLAESISYQVPAIAVLGSGVLNPSPKPNLPLFRKLIKRGLLISEYLPWQAPTKYTFPERNRIISGLCNTTVVVEAPQKSGAIITANFAVDQGRNVVAVPGPITSSSSIGCNQLIQNGAWPLATPQEIVNYI